MNYCKSSIHEDVAGLTGQHDDAIGSRWHILSTQKPKFKGPGLWNLKPWDWNGFSAAQVYRLTVASNKHKKQNTSYLATMDTKDWSEETQEKD